VKGFILKNATVNDFVTTIRSVFNGEKVLPTYLTESLFAQIIEQSLSRPEEEEKLRESVQITQREKEVIGLISDGLTNKDIASTLFISPNTIKSHVHNILEKLTLNSRLQIAKYANERK
jgi:DNA-binding NarL/FixJ family response regulator